MKIKDSKIDLLNRALYMDAANMTTTQRDALTSVGYGAMIYNSTLGELQFYDGAVWGSVLPNGSCKTGATSARPGAPSAGQLYYDTTIDKLCVYSEGGWVDYAGNNV